MMTSQHCLLVACLILTASAVIADDLPSGRVPIAFTVDKPGRVSVAVYTADGNVQLRSLLVGEWLAAGKHDLQWDGLDREGRPVEPGEYQWKLISSPGIEAVFLDSIGANPKAGPWARWIGNHHGPTTIAVGLQGICVGASIAEGPPNIHLFERDFTTTRWLSPHYGWSAFGHRAVAFADDVVVTLSQNANVSVLDVKTGALLKEFDALWAGDTRPDHEGGRGLDIDALGKSCVISHFDHDAVRWHDLASGNVVREVKVGKPRRVAIAADGAVLVLGEQGVVQIDADDKQTVVVEAKLLVAPVALAWDESNQTLLVANGNPDNRILRFSISGKLLKSYGRAGGRKPGPYHPDCFAEVADLAADEGRFYVVEGGEAGGGLRRISLVGKDGTIIDDRFGGAEFFSTASAVPGNPRELFYSSSPNTIGRYDFDPETGRNRLTHLFNVPDKGWGDGLFPKPYDFPHYRPIKHNGQVYLASNGRFVLRPNYETGELAPVALASFRQNNGWKQDAIPEAIAKAAAFHKLNVNSSKTDAFTWSDTNGNGLLDPEEFRFAESGPAAGYAFLDDEFNVLFGHYSAWNHTYSGQRWIGFDFQKSLYATLPNDAPQADVPVWDWTHIVRSVEKVPEDLVGVTSRMSPRAIHKGDDGRISLFVDGGGGGHLDLHADVWPTAQTTHTRLISAAGGRVTHSVGKHASEGPPRDTQFGMPSHLLGTVDGNLIVCDRMAYTTAWTPDGLLIGTLLDRQAPGNQPEKEEERVGLAGDDWMSAGSITDLGNGEAVWFAPSMDRSMTFRLRGFRDIKRQSGSIELKSKPEAAAADGIGLKAEYFASTDLSGESVVSRTDPRLWFSDSTTGGQMVAAWAKDGPCQEIPAGEPFSARWTGSVTAPFSEPFWFRIYNTRPGTGHLPMQQAWQDGKGYVRVWLNNQLILDKWEVSDATNHWQTPPLMLMAGATYELKVEYAHPAGDGPQFSLSWCSYTGEWMRVPTQYLSAAPAPARPRVSVSAIQSVAAEEADKPGIICFTLDHSSDKEIAIGYRPGGTSSATDYKIPNHRVVIPAGQTTAEITIQPVDDELVESNETLIVTLAPSTDYQGDGSTGAAAVTIADNDNTLVDDDLKVYYSFDNANLVTETVRNEIGPAIPLKVQAYMHTMPSLVPGPTRYGEAMTFPKGREQVVAQGTLKLADYTVAFWFKTTQKTTGICMPGPEFFLKDGALGINNSGWGGGQPAGADLADGQWHHAAFTWNQEKRQQLLYVDGVLVSTNTGPQGGGHSGSVQLGRANTGGSFTGGSLDEFRIYSRCLNGEDVNTLSRWKATSP